MSKQTDFINMLAPIVQRAGDEHDNKIYNSVCIAQAAKETGWGGSSLMMQYNAPFGIKVGNSKYHFGKAWRDKSYNAKTKEVHNGEYYNTADDFRAYDNLYDAVTDYFDMLTTASRYRNAVNAIDYIACIRAIAPSYATAEQINHSYSNSIINIIDTYDLTKFDVKTNTVTDSGLITRVDLNMRTGPGVGNKVMRVIPAGDPVELTGWTQIKYKGVTGYVNSKYLEIKKDV